MYTSMPARRAFPAVAASFALAVIATPAWGHAALQSSEPEQGARLEAVPDRVLVSYAEPPTNDSTFAVIDGCGRDVADEVEVLNETIEASVATGQPGRWRVEWSVISAVDGHLTTDEVSFRVVGETDCSARGDVPPEASGDIDEGQSSPLVPIAIAAVVIVGIGAAIRFATR